MAPDRANKNFKNGRGYGQMSKNGNSYYFTLLGCKGGVKKCIKYMFWGEIGLLRGEFLNFLGIIIIERIKLGDKVKGGGR